MTRQRRTDRIKAGTKDAEEVVETLPASDIEDEVLYRVTVTKSFLAGGVVPPGEATVKGKYIKAHRDHVNAIRPA